jgi:hypothetical protein
MEKLHNELSGKEKLLFETESKVLRSEKEYNKVKEFMTGKSELENLQHIVSFH